MSAEPTTTPSALGRRLDRLLGRRDAEAHEDRQVGDRLQPLGQHRSSARRHRAPLAGDAEQVHAVDEARATARTASPAGRRA